MPDNTYTDMLKRCVQIQQTAITGLEARPYFLWVGARFPYMLNRVGTGTQEGDSEQIERETRTVLMRLVIGHLTAQGYDGEVEDKLGDYINKIMVAFQDASMLTSTAYPTAPTYLYPLGASITSDGGLQMYQGYLGSYFQTGVEFVLTAELYREMG